MRHMKLLRLSVFLVTYSSLGAALAQQTEIPTVLNPVEVVVMRGAVVVDQPPAVQLITLTGTQLSRPGAHTLASTLSGQVSVGENYAAIGYYENFTIRGFTLDHGSSYRINGLLVSGEMQPALDNKQAVEILNGIGLPSGGSPSPGGSINYVTKLPMDVRTITVEGNDSGGGYVGADFGWRQSSTALPGMRFNFAHESLNPYAQHSSGTRDFASAAARWKDSHQFTLDADVEYQNWRQYAVPGFQLLGGTTVPVNIDPALNINQQPWSRPVVNESYHAGLRLRWTPDDTTTITAELGTSRARIDDNLAFPFGCNTTPVQFFCANGEYVLYDYHASEVRATSSVAVAASRDLIIAGAKHTLRAQLEQSVRGLNQRELTSTTRYDENGYAMSGNLSAVSAPLPAPDQVPVDQPLKRSTMRMLSWSDTVEWGTWASGLAIRNVSIQDEGADPSTATFALPTIWLSRAIGSQGNGYVSYAKGVSLGSQAPIVAENAGQTLAPRQSQQVEFGLKNMRNFAGNWSFSVFRMRRPFQFTDPQGLSWAGLGVFRQAGMQTHTGMELSADMALGAHWGLRSDLLLLRAQASGTGVPAFDHVQVQNVPKVSAGLQLDWRPVNAQGVDLSLSANYRGQRDALGDGSVTVGGYTRLDAGARWQTNILSSAVVFEAKINNVGGRRYWRDVGEAYSANLLFPGAPRTASFRMVLSR